MLILKIKVCSKIDNSYSEGKSYYKAKEIISPEILILNNRFKNQNIRY